MQVSGQPLPSYAPLVLPVLRRLGVGSKIDELVPKRWNGGVTRGQAGEVVLACILHPGEPLALFRVKEQVRELGLDVVLGVDAEKLHDNKLGEMLDALVPVDERGEPDVSLVSALEQHCAHAAIEWLGLEPQQAVALATVLLLRIMHRRHPVLGRPLLDPIAPVFRLRIADAIMRLQQHRQPKKTRRNARTTVLQAVQAREIIVREQLPTMHRQEAVEALLTHMIQVVPLRTEQTRLIRPTTHHREPTPSSHINLEGRFANRKAIPVLEPGFRPGF